MCITVPQKVEKKFNDAMNLKYNHIEHIKLKTKIEIEPSLINQLIDCINQLMDNYEALKSATEDYICILKL